MAGTTPLALSQQFDKNGAPLAGCLLYFFQVGTVATPQNAYADFGLTQVLPNPIEADQSGRLPMFWLADGQIHIRLTDSTGVVIIDTTLQVLGPSSGGGGGGGNVDPTAIFETGDNKYRETAEVLTGWVKKNGLTIGSATSGATQRANADTQNLFVYLWSYFANTVCPVSGGRGSTALSDFQANKTIGLPDWRGRGPIGLDDMGSTAAGRFSGVPFSSGNATTPAAICGEAVHALSTNEMPNHNHGVNDPSHQHLTNVQISGGAADVKFDVNFAAAQSGSINYASTFDFTGITIQNNGGGASHNNTQNSVLGTWYMKL
jgi:microcystin-dependent protein